MLTPVTVVWDSLLTKIKYWGWCSSSSHSLGSWQQPPVCEGVGAAEAVA